MAARSIHHLGVAVENLDEAVAAYGRLFGASLEHRETVEEQGVEAASLRVGDSRVELLAPTGADTPVGRFLAKRGPGMHHVAYEVDDVAAEIDRLALALLEKETLNREEIQELLVDVSTESHASETVGTVRAVS